MSKSSNAVELTPEQTKKAVKNAKSVTAIGEPQPDLTPEESIKALAKEYASLVADKKKIEARLEEVKASLIGHYKTDPFTDFEALSVVDNGEKPKLDFGTLTGKSKERVIDKLKAELPDFVQSSSTLDVEGIALAIGTNPAVRNALMASGVKIAKEHSYTLRINKEN